MCNYTYHHDPTCGHIASFNVDTCTAFTSSLRMAESETDKHPVSCTKAIHSHDLVSPANPSLCLQCEQEWMERAKKRVKAMALGETLLDEYEEQPEFVQLEGLDCPPKVGLTFTFSAPEGKQKKLIGLGITMDDVEQKNYDADVENDIFINAGVDYLINKDDDGPECDYENAHEHDTDEDGESCPTNSPFTSQDSSFFEQRQYFDFDFDYDYENSPIPEEYVHVSAVDDESSGDDDIELVYLDYPKATPDHGKLLHDLESSSESIEIIEFFDLSRASSHPEISFGDEENMQLVSGTPRSPRTKEFKEFEESVNDAAPSVTQILVGSIMDFRRFFRRSL